MENLLREIQNEAGKKAVFKFLVFLVAPIIAILGIITYSRILININANRVVAIMAIIIIIALIIYKNGRQNIQSLREIVLEKIRQNNSLIVFYKTQKSYCSPCTQEEIKNLRLYINSLKSMSPPERERVLTGFTNKSPQITVKTHSGLTIVIDREDQKTFQDSDLDTAFENGSLNLQQNQTEVEGRFDKLIKKYTNNIVVLEKLYKQLEHNHP